MVGVFLHRRFIQRTRDTEKSIVSLDKVRLRRFIFSSMSKFFLIVNMSFYSMYYTFIFSTKRAIDCWKHKKLCTTIICLLRCTELTQAN